MRMLRWAASGYRAIDRLLGMGSGGPRAADDVAELPDAGIGPILLAEDAPDLFRELGRLAAVTGGAFPGEVRLSYLPACGVLDVKESPAKTRQVLIVGLPCLQILSRAELRSVLAHEIVHLELQDAAFGREVLGYVAEARRRALACPSPYRFLRPAWLFRAGATSVLAAWAAPVARGMEYRADRLAADCFGTLDLRRAIEKIAVVQPIFREVLEFFDPVAQPRETVYGFFERVWRRIPREQFEVLRRKLVSQSRQGWFDPHPPIARRLRRLGPAGRAGALRKGTSIDLLDEPLTWKSLLHNRLYGNHPSETSVFDAVSPRTTKLW